MSEMLANRTGKQMRVAGKTLRDRSRTVQTAAGSMHELRTPASAGKDMRTGYLQARSAGGTLYARR